MRSQLLNIFLGTYFTIPRMSLTTYIFLQIAIDLRMFIYSTLYHTTFYFITAANQPSKGTLSPNTHDGEQKNSNAIVLQESSVKPNPANPKMVLPLLLFVILAINTGYNKVMRCVTFPSRSRRNSVENVESSDVFSI